MGRKNTPQEEDFEPDYDIPKVENSFEKRIFIFLEDELFVKADVYCERILDADPENALAYLGKVMAAYEISDLKQMPAFYKENKSKLSKNVYFKRFVKNATQKQLEMILEIGTCPECGAKTDSEMNFCGKCGTELKW